MKYAADTTAYEYGELPPNKRSVMRDAKPRLTVKQT
jgi:hypothetical protein